MSDLARRLIDDAQADLASRLEAIESGAGRLEEAETLAATLRHRGIDAAAHGMSFSAWVGRPARIDAWVSANYATAAELRTALAAADLRIADFHIDEPQRAAHVQIAGLEARLYINIRAAHEMRQAWLADGQEAAHG